MADRERVKYQVWVDEDFPSLLRKLVARQVVEMEGHARSQGTVLKDLVLEALDLGEEDSNV